jgi:hypothetical protein
MGVSEMRAQSILFALPILALFNVSAARADEFGFSSYGLGGSAFGAGATPPPGTYVTSVTGFYDAKVNSTVTLGNVTLAAGAHVEFFQSALNGLYVPEWTLFGGRPGVSVTVPVGHIDLAANVSIPPAPGIPRDIVAPSGRYEVGFEPNIGLHRPGVDLGWSFTWTEKYSKLQFNGTAGVTFNFENTTTDYDSGTDFHFEWAVGREICTGLMIGVVGYDYRQLTGDSGAGARLGPLEGTVDAIGGGLTYTTLVGKTPLILSARSYQEFNADKRFEGNSTIGSATVRF